MRRGRAELVLAVVRNRRLAWMLHLKSVLGRFVLAAAAAVVAAVSSMTGYSRVCIS